MTALSTPNSDEEFSIIGSTLGVKAKEFQWRIDDAYSLLIERLFKNGDAKFTAEQIDKIFDYVAQNCEVTLSNSVSRLGDGTEHEGLGRFMYETFNLTETQAQVASHLAALFTKAKIWKWNEQKLGMTFRINITNWRDALRKYYDQKLSTYVD